MQFEQLVLNGLVHERDFAVKVLNYIKPEYFSDIGQKEAFNLIFNFYSKYKAPPTKDALLIDLSNSSLPEAVYEPAATAISSLMKDEHNPEWLFTEAEKWAQRRALYLSMSQAIQVMEGNDKKISKDAIPNLIQQALAVRFDMRVGHDYLEDAEQQWDWYQNPAAKVPYLLECMNRATNGGNTRKSLSIVQAGINIGKTQFLLNIANDYAKSGLNGIFFSLETPEDGVRERMDVSLFGETSERIRAMEKTPYLNRVNKLKNERFGKLVIKEFPAGTVHAGHLRHIIKEFEAIHKVKCDFIVVDYITLMLSATLPISMKADSNYYFTNVAEELRSLCFEFDAIGWTAQQFNRGAQDSNDPRLSDSGLSIGVQATSDFTVALVAPIELKVQGKAQASILKNRFANKVHYPKFMIGINDDLQKFYDLPPDEADATLEKELDEQVKVAMSQVDATNKAKGNIFEGINFG